MDQKEHLLDQAPKIFELFCSRGNRWERQKPEVSRGDFRTPSESTYTQWWRRKRFCLAREVEGAISDLSDWKQATEEDELGEPARSDANNPRFAKMCH